MHQQHKTSIGDEAQIIEIRKCLPLGEADLILHAAQESLQDMLTELSSWVEKSDCNMIREAAHAIKGASGSLYAMRLSEMAAVMESKSEELDEIRNLMPEFEETVLATIKWWQDMLVRDEAV